MITFIIHGWQSLSNCNNGAELAGAALGTPLKALLIRAPARPPAAPLAARVRSPDQAGPRRLLVFSFNLALPCYLGLLSTRDPVGRVAALSGAMIAWGIAGAQFACAPLTGPAFHANVAVGRRPSGYRLRQR